MSIDSESDRAASQVIGPTSLGMVRIYVESEGVELPMDFEPAEALEIADELRAAAAAARATATAAAASRPGKDHRGGRSTKHVAKPGGDDGGRG